MSTAATAALVIDGVTALLNLTIRLMEARGDAALGMEAEAGSVEEKAEIQKARDALATAIARAEAAID